MAQMTEIAYKKLKTEYVKTKERLEEAFKEQQAAQAAGDLRENEEYATARRHTEMISQHKNDLEKQLAEAEIIPEDRSPRISIGTVIDICKVDKDHKPLGEVRRLTLEEAGDTIIKQVLSVKSSLGKIVLNGTSGYYTVPDNGGIIYLVKKVLD